MKISNFVLVETIKKRLGAMYYAEVDVELTTGFLFWKKTTVVRRKIVRESVGYWFFVDTGEFTPGDQVERLERSWLAGRPSNFI